MMSKPNYPNRFWMAVLAAIVCAGTTYPEIASQEQAVQVLDAALRVHGGPDAIDHIQSLSIVARGTIDQSGEVQGLHPEKACIRDFVEWLRVNRVSPERIYGVHGPWYGAPEHIKKIVSGS